MMKKIILLSGLVLSALCSYAQQDPQYSQYMFNPLLINPGYAGSREVLSVSALVRDQWTGFDGAPKTQSLTIHSPLKNNKVGLGLNLIADEIGPKKTTSFLATYAYRLKFKKTKLAFGLRAGIMNYNIDWTTIDYKDQADEYANLGSSSTTVPTFDFGIYFYGKTFFVGAASTHLNEAVYGVSIDSTNTSRARLRTHNFFTIGKAFGLGESVIFKPSILAKSVDGIRPTVDFNLSFLIKNSLWLGASMRSGSGMVFMTEVNITDKLRLGYAYDLTTNRLKYHSSGSHEIFLGYDFEIFRTKTLSPRYF